MRSGLRNHQRFSCCYYKSISPHWSIAKLLVKKMLRHAEGKSSFLHLFLRDPPHFHVLSVIFLFPAVAIVWENGMRVAIVDTFLPFFRGGGGDKISTILSPSLPPRISMRDTKKVFPLGNFLGTHAKEGREKFFVFCSTVFPSCRLFGRH